MQDRPLKKSKNFTFYTLYFAICLALTITSFFFFPLPTFAQPANSLQYQFQPQQTVRYRVDLRHEVKIAEDLPVTTKVIFQASVRTVEVDSCGTAMFEAKVEQFSVKNTLGSKETVVPAALAPGQTAQFRVGPSGLLPGQDVLKGSSGPPWNLFLSHVFPDLTCCRYLGPAVFNGQPCARIGFDLVAPFSAQTRGYNQGKGTGLFAGGRLVSGETQGNVDLGYNLSSSEQSDNPVKISAKGGFSSRLSLLP